MCNRQQENKSMLGDVQQNEEMEEGCIISEYAAIVDVSFQVDPQQ
jgi:hypothetical protein